VATKTTFGHHKLALNDQTYVNHHNLLVTKFISITIIHQRPNIIQQPKILVLAQQLTTKLWQWKIHFNFFGWNFKFLDKKLGKFRNFFCFQSKFNQISYIWAKVHKNFDTKKMKKRLKGFNLNQRALLEMNIFWFYSIIWCLWPFIKTFKNLKWTNWSSNMSKCW
jgi:hypothetical protein